MALVEVIVAARNLGLGTLPGDILDIREPMSEIGTQERKDVLLIFSEERNVPSPSDLRGQNSKHKWRIDLERLGIDMARAADPNDPYQPFVTIGQNGRITQRRIQNSLGPTNKDAR